MSTYNEFPIKGQLIDGDLVYLGVHDVKSSDVIANSFKYVTYDTSKKRLYSYTGTVDETTGEITFATNIKLVIWTYQKGSYQKGPNSTATFSTTVTGSKQYLYTEKNGLLFPPSSLSSKKIFYDTQGLPDLWAGYFGYLVVKDSGGFQGLSVKIDGSNNPSNFIVAIPTRLYDSSDSCIAIDNSLGQGLSIPISNYTKNIPNNVIYWSSENSCKSTIPINYCQNQDIIYVNNDYTINANNSSLYCGNSIGTGKNSTGSDITMSCLGTCKNFDGKSNSPICYPGTIDETLFSCMKYDSSINIYDTSEDDNNQDGQGGSGENGDEDSDSGGIQLWLIILIVVLVLGFILLIGIIILVLVKRSKNKANTPPPPQPPQYQPPQPPQYQPPQYQPPQYPVPSQSSIQLPLQYQ